MISKDSVEIVRMVYARFYESEEEAWSDLDSNLEFIGFLTDRELIKESSIKAEMHSYGIRCKQEHEISNCFAPKILEAVEYILNLYDLTGSLHPKNRYILEYYIAMSELNLIFSIAISSAV